jgi:hypothetical protein
MEQILIASDKYENEKFSKNCCFSVFNKIFVSFENGNDVFVKCDAKISSMYYILQNKFFSYIDNSNTF